MNDRKPCDECNGTHWLPAHSKSSQGDFTRITMTLELRCILCDENGTVPVTPQLKGIRNA